MPNVNFFSNFGLFFERNFLDPKTCDRLIAEINSVRCRSATIRRKNSDYIVDETFRKVNLAEVSATTESFIEQKLLIIKPKLESYFNVRLTGYESLSFLSYKPGDFYQLHKDTSSEQQSPESVKKRTISVVVFLNSEAEEPSAGSYGGGSLTFYKLFEDPPLDRYGFPLTAEKGLLVAFRSHILHEVKPVIHGQRYTVVSWFSRG